MGLALRLTPRGHLLPTEDPEAPALEPAVGEALAAAFEGGSGTGLLHLAGRLVARPLPALWGWWRDFGGRWFTAATTRPEPEGPWPAVPPPSDEELGALAETAPPMLGAEYLVAAVLRALWGELDTAFAAGFRASGLGLQDWLRSLNPAWNLVGRVHFNLAENRADPDRPFAFLATYTPRLSAAGRAQHRPLGAALQEYANAADKGQLLSLLLPVQRAAEAVSWLRAMVDAGEVFHPLRWSPQEAFRFLGDVPVLEQAGVVVRLPATWRAGRPSRPRVTATVGARPPSGLGQEALLDFDVALSVDGEPLSREEVERLLAGSRGLQLLRGRWVEVDPERLGATLARFEEARSLAEKQGITFVEAMRLLSGADIAEGEPAAAADPQWAGVVAGPWLSETLRALRAPEATGEQVPGLRGTLRPYQQAGVRWLGLLTGLGLGACLADDMGLGKTIQVLSLLLQRRRASTTRRASLLVAPASLLANWVAEIERFAPEIVSMTAHASSVPRERLGAIRPEDLDGVDLVITTYASLLRLPWIEEASWDLVVLDEAQALKNPGTRQTRAARKLRARARVALTGTPIENRLGDLWSIFDVVNPGLLGTARQFSSYTRRLSERPHNPYGPLRELVAPYVLRRLKTDRSVIADLPDKTELDAYCSLTRKQAALYQQAVADLAEALRTAEGIQRRGLVLSFLVRFKQVCNHPSQWLGDGSWAPEDSGKWARLREICEVVAARQEKVLVFSQFAEVLAPLAAFLAEVMGRPGLVLSGDTPVRQRKELVARFQEDELVPFFLLSLKAGGSGLNLTAASHVVHFDRWWNPAVEDQATDRAFRIGQSRNVLVHRFVCRGTVEDQIDAMIRTKRQLSQDVLEGGVDARLTELDDAALLRLVSLDLDAALQE